MNERTIRVRGGHRGRLPGPVVDVAGPRVVGGGSPERRALQATRVVGLADREARTRHDVAEGVGGGGDLEGVQGVADLRQSATLHQRDGPTEEAPLAKIIVLSGMVHFDQIAAKPFSVDKLLATLRRVVPGPSGDRDDAPADGTVHS